MRPYSMKRSLPTNSRHPLAVTAAAAVGVVTVLAIIVGLGNSYAVEQHIEQVLSTQGSTNVQTAANHTQTLALLERQEKEIGLLLADIHTLLTNGRTSSAQSARLAATETAEAVGLLCSIAETVRAARPIDLLDCG